MEEVRRQKATARTVFRRPERSRVHDSPQYSAVAFTAAAAAGSPPPRPLPPPLLRLGLGSEAAPLLLLPQLLPSLPSPAGRWCRGCGVPMAGRKILPAGRLLPEVRCGCSAGRHNRQHTPRSAPSTENSVTTGLSSVACWRRSATKEAESTTAHVQCGTRSGGHRTAHWRLRGRRGRGNGGQQVQQHHRIRRRICYLWCVPAQQFTVH